jgi:hypothetical protein
MTTAQVTFNNMPLLVTGTYDCFGSFCPGMMALTTTETQQQYKQIFRLQDKIVCCVFVRCACYTCAASDITHTLTLRCNETTQQINAIHAHIQRDGAGRHVHACMCMHTHTHTHTHTHRGNSVIANTRSTLRPTGARADWCG